MSKPTGTVCYRRDPTTIAVARRALCLACVLPAETCTGQITLACRRQDLEMASLLSPGSNDVIAMGDSVSLRLPSRGLPVLGPARPRPCDRPGERWLVIR
jgi:hypothetical protein